MRAGGAGRTSAERLSALGAVLAGGRSRRFGSTKAHAPFLGESMVRRVADALRTVCEDVIVVGHLPELGLAAGCPVVPDAIPGAGPLGGLHAALREARARGGAGVVLLGCDMPLVPPAVLSLLLHEGATRGGEAVAPAAGSKGVEPLCAWYSVACLDVVRARLDGEDRSLRGVLDAVRTHRIPRERLAAACDPEVALRGANTPDELAELERLATPPRVGR